MRIAQIAPLTYTPGGLEYVSFIRGGTGADYHQSPEFYQFPGGDVIMHWNAYDFDECSNDAIRLYSVSRDRGLNWTDPQVYMADLPGGSPYFVLTRGLKGSTEVVMVLVRTVMHEIEVDQSRRVRTAASDYFKSRTRVFVRRSTDGGRLFDNGSELPYEEICGGKVLPEMGFYGSADNLIQLQSGRIVAAFTFMDPSRCDLQSGRQHFTGVCLLSEDGGHSWRRSGEIVSDTDRGVMEPQIVETSPDHLFCLFRTKSGYLYQTVSEDGGLTWSITAPSPLPSPESKPRMIKLNSGNLLVVWNNVSSVTQDPRYPLVASLSSDGGRTWGTPRVIRSETGSNQLSNHSVIQLNDGRILAGISHYHDTRPMTSDLDMAVFDEQWVLQG